MKAEVKEMYQTLKKFNEESGVTKMDLLEGSNGSFILKVHDFQDHTNTKKIFKNEASFEKYLKGKVESYDRIRSFVAEHNPAALELLDGTCK